ncbi:hypothetical protein C7C46_26735 [Streptomyces tateyamensis]|uniref:Lipoprotein n=1 Tax=Streptomyces tateyamensis TaxID=565073 RepID=A0A2V4N9W6_9ACTN|nr:hypothetical protein [Streptomyces tateyamensis]PYC71681.1 hypothetical protein C7C46_26735 [Streptomyces tateyamensis]
MGNHDTGNRRTTAQHRRLAGTALLAGAVLVVSACSSGPHHTVGSGKDSIGTVITPSPTPTPYGESLNTLVGPVNDALAQLPKAGSLSEVKTALDDVQRAATSAATGLQGLNPPSGAGDANRQLYVAMDTLATNYSTVSGDIDGNKVCATSSALAEAGGVQGLKDVQTAVTALAAAGYTATFSAPQTGQLQHRALDNGHKIREGQTNGDGELTVDNGGGSVDAVLTLTQSGQAAYSFYVVKGETAKITGIRDGKYDVYFAGGFDWDDGTKKFTQSCAFTKFDDGLDFTTTSSTYSTWTLTLKPAIGGNASTSTVPPDQYPVP